MVGGGSGSTLTGLVRIPAGLACLLAFPSIVFCCSSGIYGCTIWSNYTAAPGWIIRHRLYSGFRRKREPFCRVGVVHGQVRGGEVCWVRKTYGKELLLLPTWGTRRMSRVQLDLLVLLAGCCMWELVGFAFTPCNAMQCNADTFLLSWALICLCISPSPAFFRNLVELLLPLPSLIPLICKYLRLIPGPSTCKDIRC